MTEQTKYVWLMHSPNMTSSQDQEEKQITGRVVSRTASNVKISAKSNMWIHFSGDAL